MKLVDSPRERFRTVTWDLLTDKTLPNILLGAFLTSSIQFIVGIVPLGFLLLSFVAWGASVLTYAVADEVKQTIEEEKNRLLSPEDQTDFYGIE